jgi:DNA-binding GntR family transcriptional regulator
MADDADDTDPAAHERLAAEIRTWLASGMFQPGEPVPSITDLAAERGLPRRLCARALQTLEAEGALTRYAGLGYYVTGT